MKLGGTIYLDHQATSPPDPGVLDAMRPFLGERFGNPHATEHSIGWQAAHAVEAAAGHISQMIGADPDEIIFTSGATESNNLALLGLARKNLQKQRKKILISSIEHKCVIQICQFLENNYGFNILIIPVDKFGYVNIDFIRKNLNEEVLFISILAVNNEIGTIQDIVEISKLASNHGVIFHCDAAQAPGYVDISEYAYYADMLSLSGHKMHAPIGIGALYIRRDLQPSIEPIIHGGGQQNGLRSGTLPTALCVGMGEASRSVFNLDHKEASKKFTTLRETFLTLLDTLPVNFWINGPESNSCRHLGNLNIGFKGINAADLINRMQPKLAVSTGSACTSGIPEPSHVLRAIGLNEQDASSSIRFSFGRKTTTTDVEEAAKILKQSIEKLRADNLIEGV